jgi:hypothetical protein
MNDITTRVLFIYIIILWLALLVLMHLDAAQARFGDDAIWVHHMADGSTQKHRTENGCWNAHFSQEILTGSYCEPDKSWVMVEQTEFGINTTGFKSEFGCFLGGIVASHQQGVEAQCMYLGDTAGANGKVR